MLLKVRVEQRGAYLPGARDENLEVEEKVFSRMTILPRVDMSWMPPRMYISSRS